MIKYTQLIGGFLACMSLLACDPVFENKTPQTANVTVEKSIFETRVSTHDTCPSALGGSKAAAPLVAAIVGVVAPFAIDLITAQIESYLKARTAALTGHHVAVGGTDLYRGDAGGANFGCLVIARGSYVGDASNSVVGDRVRGSLNRRALDSAKLGDFPDLYMEFDIELDPGSATDKMASMTLRPRLLHYEKTVAGRTRGNTKTINLLVAFSATPIDAATKPTKDNTVALVPLKFEDVKIGSEIGSSLLSSRAVKVPMPKDLLKGRPVDPQRGRTPLNVAIFVEETELPSGFDQILLSTYTGHKSEINTGLLKLLKQLLGVEEK